MPGKSFTMVFLTEAGEPGRRKAFKALSLSDAFLKTRNAAQDGRVELWKGRSLICTLAPGV